jgi:ribokinase
MGRVVVVGSLNVDHTARVLHLPAAGQTVIARGYQRALGGKGFNQAVTAARQGADVVLVGCVGDDEGGSELLDALGREDISAAFVRRHSGLPTGRAHITVDERGENNIVVVPGANGGTTFPSAALEGASVLLVQLEVPLSVVTAALGAARAAGVTTVLNPAPARRLSDELLSYVDYLVPNDSEASRMGDVSFGGTAIVTQGERGALVLRPGSRERRVRAVKVTAVDTVGAGDAFCGCFAAGLAAGRSLPEALRRASAAGAHAVTIQGALPSLPHAADVDLLLGTA